MILLGGNRTKEKSILAFQHYSLHWSAIIVILVNWLVHLFVFLRRLMTFFILIVPRLLIFIFLLFLVCTVVSFMCCPCLLLLVLNLRACSSAIVGYVNHCLLLLLTHVCNAEWQTQVPSPPSGKFPKIRRILQCLQTISVKYIKMIFIHLRSAGWDRDCVLCNLSFPNSSFMSKNCNPNS